MANVWCMLCFGMRLGGDRCQNIEHTKHLSSFVFCCDLRSHTNTSKVIVPWAHSTSAECSQSALHSYNGIHAFAAKLVQAIDKLSGDWKLLYTVNSELTGLLGLSRLPGVQVGEISQSIDPYTLSIRNTVTVGGPVSRSAFSAKAAFEILSPKRIQVPFHS